MLPLEKTMPALERRLPQLVKQTCIPGFPTCTVTKSACMPKGKLWTSSFSPGEFYRFEWGCHFFPSCIRFPSALRSSTDCKGGITGDFETTRPSEALLTWRTTTKYSVLNRSVGKLWTSFLSWGMLSFRVGLFFCLEGKRMHEGKT